MKSYILSLSAKEAILETVGGKGASLAKMARADLPVPDGFHVTTQAYRAFVEANSLQNKILNILKEVDPSKPDSLEDASREIGNLFARGEMPAEIATAVRDAYNAFNGGEISTAVRSSATAEDLPEASFAGQQETFLNVRGYPGVIEAVKKCWASLWTARAIAYRMKKKIDQKSIALAVVVQELVPSEAAGILFTVNPITGMSNEVVINASWGLGEAVVSGEVSPDAITADKNNGKIINMEVAEKTRITVSTADGTELQELKGSQRKAKVLTKKQVAKLVNLACQVEDLYGKPQDIEWCYWNKSFYIVQSRPITTLKAVADWTLPNPKAYYMRGSLAEHLPNAVSPLFSTLALRTLNKSIAELGDMMSMDLMDAEYQYRTINGYVYMGYVLSARLIFATIKTLFSNLKYMYGDGSARWLEARGVFSETIEKWKNKTLRDLSSLEILRGTREMMYAAGKYYTVIQATTLPSASTSEMIFGAVYKMLKREGDPEVTELLLGADSVALQAEKSLFDLAKQVDEKKDLRDYVQKTASEEIGKFLTGKKTPQAVSPEDWQQFREGYCEHIRKFGATAYEFDFVNPAPAEMPEVLMDTLKVYLEGKGGDPYKRQLEAQTIREETLSAIKKRFKLIPNRWIEKSLNWIMTCSPLRENSLADMGMAHPTIRIFFRELGNRLVKGGAIKEAKDIYWLEGQEVQELAGLLEKGQQLSGYHEKVAKRKVDWETQMDLVPPAILPATAPFAKMIPWSRTNVSSNMLTGLAASAGTVTATARVLFGPEDFSRMQSGDVLVAVTTTPAWTPLFTMASAIVTDIGGPLSHSSIVAREYGIPAVLATGLGTRRIQDGQTIIVNGSAGTVTLK